MSIAKTKGEIQRDYEKRTGYAATKKWQAQHVKRYGFPVMMDTESDVIQKLESVPNKSGYIKDLIKKDIVENGI